VIGHLCYPKLYHGDIKNLASFSFADAVLVEEYDFNFQSLKEGKRT